MICRKKWPFFFIFVCSVFMCFVCRGQSVASVADTVESISVKAVVLKDFPPLYLLDSRGKPAGFAIDILEAIAEDQHLDVTYVVVDNWAQAMASIRSGEADIIPGIGISAARQEEFLFSEPIETIPVSCFVRKGNYDITSIDDVRDGHTVAVIEESAAMTRMTGMGGFSLHGFTTIETALCHLLSGEVDAFVFPQPVLWYKARMIGVAKKIKVVGQPLMELKRGYVLGTTESTLHERINAGIRNVLDSAQYRDLYTQWYGEAVPFWTVTRVVLVMSGVCVAVFVVLFVWRHVSMSFLNTQLLESIRERDETEKTLRDSEEKYRILLENLPQRVFFKDKNGVYVSCNHQFAEDIGLAQDDIVGKTDFDLFPHELAKKYRTDDERIMNEGCVVVMDEPCVFKEVARSVNTTKKAVCDSEGTVIGILGIYYDVTVQRQMEAKLIESQRMDSIGNLAGGIAHDFNNMLSGILGFCEILQISEQDTKKRKHLANIEKAAERARQLTQKLLAFARRGKFIVDAVDMNQLVGEVSALLERTIDKSITLEVRRADDLYSVDGDIAQLYQVLMNVCVNAAEAMPNGGTLVIETQNVHVDTAGEQEPINVPAGEYCMVCVTDTGCGISQETQAHVFDPFFSTKKDGSASGTGLGLSTVYGIVKNHDGVIVMNSDINSGTRVSVYLPKGWKKKREVLTEKKGRDNALVAQRTILVVDDEDVVRTMLQQALQSLGHRVFAAENGRDAIQIYAEHAGEIDGVIIDMVMPEMGGKETFEHLHAMDPSVKVLIASGFSLDGSAQELLHMGARGFLQKPFSLKQLVEHVNGLFRT